MIVRDVVKNPQLIRNFDYFNDYQDTINWLSRNHPDQRAAETASRKLEAGFQAYLATARAKK